MNAIRKLPNKIRSEIKDIVISKMLNKICDLSVSNDKLNDEVLNIKELLMTCMKNLLLLKHHFKINGPLSNYFTKIPEKLKSNFLPELTINSNDLNLTLNSGNCKCKFLGKNKTFKSLKLNCRKTSKLQSSSCFASNSSKENIISSLSPSTKTSTLKKENFPQKYTVTGLNSKKNTKKIKMQYTAISNKEKYCSVYNNSDQLRLESFYNCKDYLKNIKYASITKENKENLMYLNNIIIEEENKRNKTTVKNNAENNNKKYSDINCVYFNTVENKQQTPTVLNDKNLKNKQNIDASEVSKNMSNSNNNIKDTTSSYVVDSYITKENKCETEGIKRRNKSTGLFKVALKYKEKIKDNICNKFKSK